MGVVTLSLLVSLAATSDTQDASIAVVRAARDRVLIGMTHDASHLARVGEFIAPGPHVTTGTTAWAEIGVGTRVRLRVSASSQLAIRSDKSGIELYTGRLWVQFAGAFDGDNARAFHVHMAHHDCAIAPGSSVVVETTPSGVAIAVRRGRVEISSNGAPPPLRVERDEVALLAMRGGERSVVTAGGSGTFALVSLEARIALGDWLGIREFLVAQALTTRTSPTSVKRALYDLRGGPDVSGTESGPAADLVETALRPPPFFADEVPVKGPNVRVEISYGDE